MAGPAFNSARNDRHTSLLIDGRHHFHHLASDQLVLLVIRRKVVLSILLNMAESTCHAQLDVDHLHLRDNLRPCHIFQDLNINERLFCATPSAASTTAALLRGDMSRNEKHRNCENTNRAHNPIGQLSHEPSLQADDTNTLRAVFRYGATMLLKRHADL